MPGRNITLRNAARWIILLGTLILAALFLNSAFFSLWVAGGPPTPYPEAWMHRALANACTAVALLLMGIAGFRCLGSFPRIGSFTLLLGLGAITVLVVPWVREFMLVDSCLDSGGRWEELAFRCVK